MPTIVQFYGILIQMYYNDHSPPHFHVRYGNARAGRHQGRRGHTRRLAANRRQTGERLGLAAE